MQRLFLIPLFLFLALGLVLALSLEQEEKPAPQGDTLLGQSIPSFTLERLDGKNNFDNALWRGKTAVLNVFASWCVSCLAEQPLLLKLKERGIPVYGIAWKDKPEALKAWLQAHGNPYRAIGLDPEGRAAIALGLKGVPETYLIGTDGTILWHYPGALTDDMVEVLLRQGKKK